MVKISFNKYIPVYHKSRRDYRIKNKPSSLRHATHLPKNLEPKTAVPKLETKRSPQDRPYVFCELKTDKWLSW